MPKKDNRPKINLKPMLHIYCEGEKTEPNYLNSYLDKFHPANRLLKVIKVEYTKKNTPVALVKVAIKAKKEFPDGDVFWVVYDRESPQKCAEKLHSEAYNNAKKNGVSIAISNVCFEIWLLLHFQNNTASYSNYDDLRRNSALRSECKKRGLKDYDKGEKNIFSIFTDDDIKQVRMRARRMNIQSKMSANPLHTKPYQWNPYTNVHHLIRAIDRFAKE